MQEFVVGKKSGFAPAVQEELRRWNDMFHLEVHGGRLTFAIDGAEWLTGEGTLPVSPKTAADDRNIGIYINHVEQVQWMFLRCLCYLQVSDSTFSTAWRHQWSVLDDSFAIVRGAANEDNRSSAAEFLTLMKQKFAFSPEKTRYWERSSSPPAA